MNANGAEFIPAPFFLRGINIPSRKRMPGKRSLAGRAEQLPKRTPAKLIVKRRGFRAGTEIQNYAHYRVLVVASDLQVFLRGRMRGQISLVFFEEVLPQQ
jgi:hypothetical protein